MALEDDVKLLNEVDLKLPHLRPLLNRFALHPDVPQIESDLQAYINLARIKVGIPHYEELMHIYNNICATRCGYEN